MIRGLPAAGLFFFSSWLTMIFWGIVAPDLGGRTISYPMAMLITIALWLVVAPLILILARQRSFQVVKWNANRYENQG
jgi:hypothetical protein